MNKIVLILIPWIFTVSCKTVSSLSTTKNNTENMKNLCEDPQEKVIVMKEMADGDFFEVDIDSSRKIVNITMDYNGQYNVPLIENGKVVTNEEGQQYYKDGMYAQGYILSASGEKTPVSVRKFIDSYEIDNWHDLNVPKGEKLRIDFMHRENYREEILKLPKSERTIQFNSILIRYEDPENLPHDVFMYNKNYESALSSDAKILKSGDKLDLKIESGKKICRVDVRWGDAKPYAADGTYVPGYAQGTVIVNGEAQEMRNVARIETQVFSISDITNATESPSLSVTFEGDEARVHWVKVYYKE